jgi:translation initiation factor eIF-2B subunit alpha
MIESKMPVALEMTDHMIQRNPTLDYTTPDLIKLIVTDLGAMTPSVSTPAVSVRWEDADVDLKRQGVSDALLGIYGGE